jgi:hypothetical protein
MFVVTPSLDSIEYKFNSKSIKFPKLHKVPTLEAININKPWSEWKERLRNFGVKPPRRGIELGWVTRGTRPRKPSSRGFACEARGAWGTRGTRGSRGSWGLKTEYFFLLFSNSQQPKKLFKIFYFLFYFIFLRVHRDAPMSTRMHSRVRADVQMSTRTQFLPRSWTVKIRPRVKPRWWGKRGCPDEVCERPNETDVRTVIFTVGRPL